VDLRGKRVLVLGMARSGVAAAKLLRQLGAQVTVNDQKERAAVEADATFLERLGVEVVTGGHPPGLMDIPFDLMVKNPGIPYSSPPVIAALRRGIPVITEVELAYRVSRAPLIGITGSNGKTTTTSLVGDMLRRGGKNPVVAGNIGIPLSEIVPSVPAGHWIVAELSSFQLMGTDTFRPRIGALLNVYRAHLDYHGDMESYLEAKLRLFRRQTSEDTAVVHADLAGLLDRVRSVTKAYLVPFSRIQSLPQGAFVRDGRIVVRVRDTEAVVCPVEQVALPGLHNLENILAAVAIAAVAGVPREAVEESVRLFQGVEHRLEFVREVNDVRFYNDSKATNAEAAARAVTSFDRPVVLIAGGLDRGDDFQALDDVFRHHLKALIVLGQSADKLAQAGERAGVGKVRRAPSLEEAVNEAARLAGPGDVVLLSPACASWDMFSSFEERGRIFKEAVNRL
jgi:UDP-N-acetylmuramoylalanine--D-glutamate ligase